MKPEVIKALKPLIKEFEGYSETAYLCPAGVWTIGYGHTGPEVKKGVKWTAEKCEQTLQDDMLKYFKSAVKWSPDLINASPSRQAAIVDFVYNCGEGNYSVSSLLLSVNKGDWSSAAINIKKWNKARNPKTKKLEILNGLVRRRELESKLLLVA